MCSLISLVLTVLNLYFWVVIASAVFSWLIAFNVVNTGNRFIYTVVDTLYRLTEPALRPIRQFLPNLGGIDVSPVVLLLGLIFLQNLIIEFLGPSCAPGY